MIKLRNLVAAIGLLTVSAAAGEAPNFIIFYMDDLGWAQTSVKMMDSEPLSVHPFYETPSVERLSARGMRFSNGYAPTPTCTGSRVSIQFGQSSARIQYRFVHDVLSYKQRPDGYAGVYSLADAVKTSGKNYITAHFGKGMVDKLKVVNYDVTDEFEKHAPNGNLHGDKIDIASRKPLPPDDPKRMYSLTKSSVDFVKEHAGKRPFYLMVSHYAVHVPHAATQRYIDKYQAKYDALPNKPTDKAKLNLFERERKVLYGAMLEEADQNLGLLMDELEQAGELDNTYIIFTSDNGSECIPRTKAGRRNNGPLQEGKYSCFEGGLRVPFIAAGPGIQGGTQCDVPVVQWDLLATLHDLSGNPNPLPDTIDGGSLKDVFARGNRGQVKRNAPGLVFHFPSYYQVPASCIRIGDYKFMRNMNTDEVKLFNVNEDYREQHDLAQSMPEKAAEMDRILRNYIDEVDGGDVKDVYQAHYELLDEFERREKVAYTKKLEALEKGQPTDIEEQKARLKEEHEMKQRSFYAKRKIQKRQETWPGWYTTARKEVEAEIGMTKGGKIKKVNKK